MAPGQASRHAVKVTGFLVLTGAVLGTIVAVVVHYLTKQPPSRFGFYGYGLTPAVIPLRHPSWWPMLASSIGIGALAGALTDWAIRAGGGELRLTRRHTLSAD